MIAFLTLALTLFSASPHCATCHDGYTLFDDSVASAQIPYAMDEQARQSLLTLLDDSSKTGWRLALDSDNTNAFLGRWREESNKTYEPYFLQEDFSGDGRTDFLIALVKEKQFVVFFFKSKGEGYASPQSILRISFLNEWAFFNQGKRLQIGAFYSGDLISFTWNSSKQSMELEPMETEE